MATKVTPKISDAVEAYLAQQRPFVARNTYAGYATYLRRFAGFIGSKQIGRVTTDELINFLGACADGTVGRSPCCPRTVRKVRNHLNGFFRWARERNYSNVHPESIKLLKVGDQRKDYLRLNPDQIVSMIENCVHPRDRIFIAIAVNTALRAHSITAIQIKDVHLDQGYLYIRIAKTHEVDRLAISGDLDSELRRWITWYQEHADVSPDSFLVPSKEGHRFIGPGKTVPEYQARVFPDRRFKYPNDIIKVQLKKLGYSDDELRKEGAHTLRRSAAVAFRELLIQNGVTDTRPVSAFLHHKSETTTSLYLGWDKDKEIRDTALSGNGFLSALTSKPDNVVSLDERRKV